jgi:hypothetical protein
MARPRGSIHRGIGIEFDDSEFLDSLDDAVAAFHADAQKAIEVTANAAATEMRRRAGSDHELAASIKVTKGHDYVEVGSGSPHGIWREFGTGVFGPGHHPIVPRRAEVLAGGLHHPVAQVAGMHPQPWFRPSINAALRRFRQAFR